MSAALRRAWLGLCIWEARLSIDLWTMHVVWAYESETATPVQRLGWIQDLNEQRQLYQIRLLRLHAIRSAYS